MAILPPSDIKLDSIRQIATSTGYVNQITLSFINPIDIDYTGVKIYFSFDDVTYSELGTYLDRNLDKVDGRTIVDQQLIELFDGRDLWIKILAFTTYNLSSSLSSALTFETKATPTTIDDIYFDTKKTTLELSTIPVNDGRNSKYIGHQIVKYRGTGVKYLVAGASETNIILSSDSFIVGERIRVWQLSGNTIWEGDVEEEGFFTISSSNELINNYLFKYNKAAVGDFNVYIKSTILSTIVYSSSIYEDILFDVEDFYFYGVSSLTPTTESISFTKGVYIVNLPKTHPTLRVLEQSNTSLLKDSWRDMKNFLYDDNYYDKKNFALPFVDSTSLDLLIYLGVYNVTVDIWLNEEYLGDYPTSKEGEVTIPIILRKGESEIKIRLRNEDSTVINSNTFTFNLHTYLKYIFFLVFGFLLEQLKDTIDNAKSDIFLSTTTYLDRFADLVSIFRIFGWTQEEYRAVIQKLIIAFKDIAVIEGIEKAIEAFHVVDHFWIWEYLDPERTIRVGEMITSTGVICREDYLYGVSACKYNGEETTPSLLRIDGRWHSPSYYTVNAFDWDEVEGADFYKIYRGIDTGAEPLGLLTSTGSTVWIDHNTIDPDFGQLPLTLNYSSMTPPTNLDRVIVPKVRDEDFFYYSGGILRIIVYGLREFLSKEKELIFEIIRRIIPCELKLQVYFTTDSGTSIIDWT